MKIKAIGKIGNILEGDIVDAILNKNLDTATAFDPILSDTTWLFYRDKYPQFEIMPDEKKYEDASKPIYSERSFTLDELKQLKELFK